MSTQPESFCFSDNYPMTFIYLLFRKNDLINSHSSLLWTTQGSPILCHSHCDCTLIICWLQLQFKDTTVLNYLFRIIRKYSCDVLFKHLLFVHFTWLLCVQLYKVKMMLIQCSNFYVSSSADTGNFMEIGIKTFDKYLPLMVHLPLLFLYQVIILDWL